MQNELEKRIYEELEKQFEGLIKNLKGSLLTKTKDRLSKIASHSALIFSLKLQGKKTDRYEKLIEANILGLQSSLAIESYDKVKTMIYDSGVILINILRGVFK